MRKYLLFFASAMLLFAGCAKEGLGQGAVADGEAVEVNIATSLPMSAKSTKAVWDSDGNAANVDHWIMEVYDKQEKLYDRQELTGQTGLTKTFKVTLIKNQTYKFVFWADKQGSYTTSDLTDIKTVLSSDSREAGKDALDAFYCMKEYKSTKSESISAVLKRPFGQVNIVTLDTKKVFDEIGNETEYGKFIPKDLKVTAKVYNGFNALADTLADLKEVDLTEEICYGKAPYSYAEPKDSTTLFMDYLFVSEEQELVDLAFEFLSNEEKIEYSFAAIPVRRNYRTNIMGNLLSNDAEWTVTIDPEWETPDYVEERWAAGMITPVTPVEDVYTISLPSELAWVAQQVNAGNTFAGKTVKLAKDIDLNNGVWTPMGGVTSYPSVAFHGTLDGNNHKILNLNCSDNTENYAAAALIGAGHCTVKDLTIENVKVASTHYAAALVGYVGDGGLVLANCKVKNGTITSTPEWLGSKYDNGDKVGGLVGYCAGACTISGCSVEGLAIKAYRDLGGIAGAAKCADIKNNTVKNCTIIADQTVNFYGKKDYNVGAIVGRSLEGTVDASNTAENVTVNCTVSDGLSFNPEGKKLIVSSAKGLDAVRNNLNPDYMNRVISVVPGDGVQSNLYCIELANDITLTDAWTTISLAANQSIELDGNNKTISGLTVSGQEYAALFTSRTAYYNSFKAKNLTISGAQITGTSTESEVKDDYAGAILACAGKCATLTNCSVINSSISNAKRTGAMMGMNNGPESVEFANLTVSGCTITGVYDATGGVFGHMQTYANVLYQNVVVSETTISVPAGKTLGGIVGRVGAEGETYTFQNCSYNGVSTEASLCGQVLNGSRVVIQND